MRKSFKFLRDNPFYSEEEERNARTLLLWLIMTSQYETTIYPKVYDNQYNVHSITTTTEENSIRFISNITVIGGGTYLIDLSI